MVSSYTCIILYSEFTNPQKEGPEVIPIKGPSTLLHLNTIMIHQTHYEKTDWARAFNQLSVHSAVEVTKFLLQEGFEFVLTERFCQDPVEEYFGGQQKLGRRSDNPDIKTFGYNSNVLRMQRTVSCQSGNTRGRKDKTRAWEQVTDVKLPCRKKIETVVNFIIEETNHVASSVHFVLQIQ